jgi:hypothetical protein
MQISLQPLEQFATEKHFEVAAMQLVKKILQINF